jgi:hypothetical protein
VALAMSDGTVGLTAVASVEGSGGTTAQPGIGVYVTTPLAGLQLPTKHGLVESTPTAVGFEHWPVDGSQVPATWHLSDAEQVTAPPATQVPDAHISSMSQRLPSLQAVPLGAAGFEHCPVVALHVPATWHWSDAAHVTVPPAVQTPL